MILSVKKLQTIKQNIIRDVSLVFGDLSKEYKEADKMAKEKKDSPIDYNYWAGYRDGIIATTVRLLGRINKVRREYGITGKEE